MRSTALCASISAPHFDPRSEPPLATIAQEPSCVKRPGCQGGARGGGAGDAGDEDDDCVTGGFGGGGM
eukprot:6056449-Prymnesium_polylepis.1